MAVWFEKITGAKCPSFVKLAVCFWIARFFFWHSLGSMELLLHFKIIWWWYLFVPVMSFLFIHARAVFAQTFSIIAQWCWILCCFVIYHIQYIQFIFMYLIPVMITIYRFVMINIGIIGSIFFLWSSVI